MDPFENLTETPDLNGEVTLVSYRPIFTGPYSCVYRGKLRHSGEIVAIKVLNAVEGAALHTMQRKLRRERRTWGALNHPNILPLYGFADDEEMFQPFGALISPWLQRGDSTRFLAEHGDSLSIEDRMNLWKDVITGVEYLHTYQPLLVHGDLKPKNILIGDSGRAQICDFGLVRIFLNEGSSGMTTTTHHTGTERYLASELVFAGEDACPTTASDVYALGCIGLEFIFSQVPYSNRKNNLGGMIYVDIRAGLPPAEHPPMHLLDLEDTWWALENCWEREPHARPDVVQLLLWLETTVLRIQHGTYTVSDGGMQSGLPSLDINEQGSLEDPPSSTAGITAGALPPNGSHLRSRSVTGMRPTASVGGAQVKTDIPPTVIPNRAAANIEAPIHSVTQPQQPLRNQNFGTNQPQPAWQAPFPPPIPHPYVTAAQANPLAGTNNNNPSRLMTATAAPTGPMDVVSFQTGLQVENVVSSSPEYQRELILKLKNVLEEHQRVILRLQSENRHLEAKERMARRDEVRDFVAAIVKARQAQGNPAGPTAGPSRQPFQSDNINNLYEGVQNTLSTNMSASMGNRFNHQLSGSHPPQNPVQPQNPFIWRGSFSVMGHDGRRASPEILVFLDPIKATYQQEHALSAWPRKISMTPIRQNTPSDRLVNWLGQNKPEGLFSVRALELEHWQASQRTPDNAMAIQESMKNLIMAQNAIIVNKLVLHGTINLTTGGTVTLILMSEPQIAIARYTTPPNLNTLPGVPLPTPPSIPNAPAGAHDLNPNINVGNSGSNGWGVNTDLLRRASLLANQRGISPQDALNVLLNHSTQQQNSRNGSGAGG